MACLVQKSSSGVESSNSSTWTPLYGGARLDQDTIQYFHKFYCKDCRMEKQAAERAKASAAAGGDNGGASSTGAASGQPSSPQNSLEEFSLQQTMDKNKESLKRKLMLRRSVNELVDQGIYPPLKTPPAYAEQRKQLERAKTGDLLRHKIQHRPDRESLVNQHILEDTKVDPSLADRQRQLKRARLADGLNDKLSHRPGPLELVQGNILQTNEELAEAIKVFSVESPASIFTYRRSKEGLIKFQRTSDGEELDLRVKQQFTCEEESTSDEAFSPSQPGEEDSNLSDIGSPGSSIASTIDFGSLITRVTNQGQTSPTSKTTVTIPPGQPYAVPSGHSVVGNRQTTSSSHSSSSRNGNSSSSSQHKSRPKKPKPKTQPKAKVIKFHEYKGPPNIVKNIHNAAQNLANNSETPYHILLQQQQLFLQWQLEFQQKNLLAGSTAAAAVATAPKMVENPHLNASGSMMVAVPASPSPSPTATTTLSQPAIRQSPSPSMTPKHQLQPQQTPPPPPPPPPLPSLSQQQQQQHHHHQHHITMIPQTQVHQNQIPHLSPCPSPAHHQLQQHQHQHHQQQANVNSPALLKALPNLDEMKVADLRAELKKRNLTVSGSKPQLIERLRNFIETKSNNTSSSSPTITTTTTTTTTIPSGSTTTTTTTNQVLSSILDNNSNISQPAVQAVVYTAEESMLTNISPPTSPNSKETSNRTLSNLSFDKLDFTSNFLLHKNHLNNAMSNVPMTVDQISRPPSVAPGEIAPMDIDHVNSIHDLGQSLTSAPKAVGVVSPQQQMQPLVPTQQRGVIAQEELVKQQQKKIEELQRQLQESQLQLHLQLQQHQLKVQLQQQQQQLQQQQQQQQQQNQLPNLIKQQPQSPAQVMSVQSPPGQVMSVQSPAQVMTVHSPPQVMTMHSPPHVMTVHSPQIMNMHSPQQILNVQSPQQILNVQSPPQIMNPQSPSHQILSAQSPSHILMNIAADSKVTLPPPLSQAPPSLQVQQSLSSIALTPIPISAHLIQTSTQSVQSTQSLPTMIVTTSTTGPDIKPNFNELFNKQQRQQQQQQQQKSPSHAVDFAKLGLSPSQSVTPFILSVSQANSREGSPSPNSLICSPGMTLGSLTSSPLPVLSPTSESTQVTSALGTQASSVNSIDSSNSPTGFFSIPLREPPKYDEAVKNKHQIPQGPLFVTMQDGGNNTLPSSEAPTSGSSGNPVNSTGFSISTKSQAMDDVLEILIRNGELPPSAAQEPPPAPKTTAQTSTIPTVSVTQTAAATTSSNTPFSLATVLMPSPSLTTNSTSSSLVNQQPVVSATVPAPTPVLIKQEPDASPPSSAISCDTHREFVDINEVLNHDFNTMDWTSEGGFTNLDLPDSLTDHKFGTSTLPIITKTDASNPGSSTDLGVTLDLPHDTDNSCNMQIDVSDWLDVVIPSTGFAPASLNTPISFTSSDPILTPKTQQDVLDMFSFDDTDFTASSDSQCGMDWDKLTDPSTSSS